MVTENLKKKLAAGLEEAEAFSFGLGRKTSPDEGSRDDPDPDEDTDEADRWEHVGSPELGKS